MTQNAFIFILSLCILLSCQFVPDISLKNLSVEMKSDPVGIDIVNPRLSWQIESKISDVNQSHYQIIVASSEGDLNTGNNLLWNSGKVKSDTSIFVPYEGKPLKSRQICYWKVKVWTNKGETLWSYGKWEMAFLDPNDWKAKWIGLESITNSGEQLTGFVHTRLAARYLRKEFDLKTEVKNARLYISGVGLYECFINGEKVSDDIFAPSATEYTKRVFYNVYDITNFLYSDKNTIGVILGNGRYVSMRLDWDKSSGVPPLINYGFPKLICQLEIEYNDGEKEVVTSDSSWKISTKGPIVANNEYDGEEYNANFELGNWLENKYHCDGSNWEDARIVEGPIGKLVAQPNPNIRIMKELRPIGIEKNKKGGYILDMGQNMVGFLHVNLYGIANAPLKMRFAETLSPDGSLYLDNMRGAEVTDTYIPSKDGVFSWEPKFTYHGFRYVEITGLDTMPSADNFIGKVMYDRLEDIGSFETSNKILNQIYRNTYWGLIGNYRSFPTDCPQRDERMAWLGDRSMGCFGESFMFDIGLFYEKWEQDIEDCQKETGSIPDQAPTYWKIYTQNISDNVTWPSTFIFVPQMLYEQLGDIKPIEKHYTQMRLWVNYMVDNYLEGGLMARDQYGDWCVPPQDPKIIFSQDPLQITSGEIIGTTFFYRVLKQMSTYAELLNKENDKQEYLDLADQMKINYNKKYFDEGKALYGNNTVTANLISLMQGLVPEDRKLEVFDGLVQRIENDFNSHVSVGLIGIQFLMRGLTKYRRGDIAYKIATNNTYPSWGYMVENGATTIWELWNGNTADPAMNSGNHLMLLGDLIPWCYEDLAGIKTSKDYVGFKKIIMNPYFLEGLDFVNASHESPYGKIVSEWKRENHALLWNITIPCNSSALVSIPTINMEEITINGEKLNEMRGMKVNRIKDDCLEIEVPSGNYNIKITEKI